MRWFARSKNDKDKNDKDKTPPITAHRPERRPATDRPRRERYSGWNDPDLPVYGDPFDG